MPNGNGQPGNIQGPFTDPQGREYYTVGGVKSYVSPNAGGGGTPLTNGQTWNQDTGEAESGVNWGMVLDLVVAGALTVGIATALLGGGEAAETAVSTAVDTGSSDAGAEAAGVTTSTTVPNVTTADVTAATNASDAATGPTLEGTATGPGSTTVATGGTPAGTSLGVPDQLPGALDSQAGTPGFSGPLANANTAIPGGAAASPASAAPVNSSWTAPAGTSTASKIANLVGAAGQGIGGAAEAGANNQLAAGNLQVSANNSNITGQSDYETELLNTTKENQSLKTGQLADSLLMNSQQQAPSPYNLAPPTVNPSTAALVAQRANTAPTLLPNPTPYTPINPQAPGSGTFQQVANYVAPGLTIASKIIPFL